MGESRAHDRLRAERKQWDAPSAVVSLGFIAAVVARTALLPYISGDSSYFLLPWMQEFRINGALALGGEFSNYNFPYLFLMFLASLLPLEPLLAIKIVSLAGDLLLAFSVAALFAQFRPAGISPKLAALIALFLPTVLLNASMWGQCDSIYSSFLLLALKHLLANNGLKAWLFWAIALSFKLQAVFFLPALALISLRDRHSPILPVTASAVWVALSVPPVCFGRSLESTLLIYVNQTSEDYIFAGAANIYSWVPLVTAEQGKIPALIICAIALTASAIAYWRGEDSAERKVLFALTVVAVCPLLLPQMHERYFFVAEVMSILFLRQRKLRLTVLLFAGTGGFVYVLYFSSNQYALPLMLASIFQCVAVGVLLVALWRRNVPLMHKSHPELAASL